MRRLVFFLFVLSVFAGNAWACSCAGPVTVKQEFVQVKAVFTAHVGGFNSTEQGVVKGVHLNIDKVWKGEMGEALAVSFPRNGCSYWDFKVGKSYLVYAHASRDKHSPSGYDISMCSRTKLLDRAFTETRYLDAIVAGEDTSVIDKSLPSILLNKKGKTQHRVEIVKLLGSMLRKNTVRDVPAAVNALVESIDSSSAELKIAIAHNLTNPSFRDNFRVKNALLQLLLDSEQDVSNAAASAFAMVTRQDSNVFQALIRQLSLVNKKHWQDEELHEFTVMTLGVSIAKVASTAKEKHAAVDILLGMIGRIDNPYHKVSIIQHLGFLNQYASKASAKLVSILSASEHSHVKQYTLSALGDIKAVDEIDSIKPYVKDKSCYVVKHAIEAVYKITPEEFPSFFRAAVMPEMKARFEACQHEFIWTLQTLGPAAKALRPFLQERYKTLHDNSWLKGQLSNIISNLQ